MIIDVDYVSDVGLVRDKNQDALFVDASENVGIFVVADGMGGHSRGEMASSYVVNEIAVWWSSHKSEMGESQLTDIAQDLERKLKYVNRALFQMFSESQEIGGTTLCVLLIYNEFYAVLSVGDSRIYKYEKHELLQITRDDVWENTIQTQNYEEEIAVLKDKRYGKLTQAMGSFRDVTIKVSYSCVSKKTVFLLCSDGIYKFCEEKSIRNAITSLGAVNSASSITHKICQQVVTKGAKDNYSIVVCTTR